MVLSALLPALVSAQTPDPEQPDAAACRALGLAAVHGDGRPRDLELGIKLLKQACALGDQRSCGDVDELLQAQLDADTAQKADPQAQSRPPQGPVTEPPPETFGDEEHLLGSRWGAVGRLAGSLSGSLQSTSDSGLHAGLSAGGGVRFALFAPKYDRVYLGPAIALLVDGEVNNLLSVGLEARLEFLVVSPGGMLQPWFNVWLSAGVRAAYDHSSLRPTQFVGVGIGGNVFSNGFGWLFGTNLGGGGSFYGVVATAVGMAIIGLLHFEARLEAIDGSDLLYHFIIGIGF